MGHVLVRGTVHLWLADIDHGSFLEHLAATRFLEPLAFTGYRHGLASSRFCVGARSLDSRHLGKRRVPDFRSTIHSTAGLFAMTFGVAFCIFAIPTNQIHQWAHMRRPPRWIQFLQKTGLILTKEEHARHHKLPYSGHYCITNGFCNRWLEAFGFFRSLEKIITSLTGVPPRLEETRQFNDRKK